MSQVLTKEQVLMRDIQHLATDVVTALAHPEDFRSAAELAETCWHKLRLVGQVRGPWDFFRALDNGQIEWLSDCGNQMYKCRVCDILSKPPRYDVSLWLFIESSYLCSAEEYEAAKAACTPEASERVQRAEERWYTAQAELEAEGTLPYHRPKPSAVGGTRYITEVSIANDMAEAFREALDEYGGVVLNDRPSLGCKGQVYDSRYYTISLVDVNDQFEVARLMVLIYYANKPKAR